MFHQKMLNKASHKQVSWQWRIWTSCKITPQKEKWLEAVFFNSCQNTTLPHTRESSAKSFTSNFQLHTPTSSPNSANPPLGFLPQESAAEPTEGQPLPKPEDDDPPKTSVGSELDIEKNHLNENHHPSEGCETKKIIFKIYDKILQIDRESAGHPSFDS